MMLREGWDVRSVTVVLGLRPFTADAEILPEQVIGRGLRLLQGIGPDRTQTLEVCGTQELLATLRKQLEVEGVGYGTTKSAPPAPIKIEPMKGRMSYDIAIPLTKPRLVHTIKKLSDLKPTQLKSIHDESALDQNLKLRLKLEFATTNTAVHKEAVAQGTLPLANDLIAAITNKVIQRAKLTANFATLFPLISQYITSCCFGVPVDVDSDKVRTFLNYPEIQDAIAAYIAQQVSKLIVETRKFEFEKKDFRLSQTLPFSWRRDLPPPLECERTVFNFVASYNKFERRFAQFLDMAPDVLRFASLGTTEQGDSGTQFRVDYLKLSGAIGFYHPDWAVVQNVGKSVVNWIIETKGRVWEGTDAKDEAISDWCARISKETGQTWKFARVNQGPFDAFKPKTLSEAIANPDSNQPDLV
jgi:type III restriction enzyme